MSSKQWGHGHHTGEKKGVESGRLDRMTEEGKESQELYFDFKLPSMIETLAGKIAEDIRTKKEVTPEAHFLAMAISRLLSNAC